MPSDGIMCFPMSNFLVRDPPHFGFERCYSLRGKGFLTFCGSCVFTIFTVLPHGSVFSDFLGLNFRDLRVRADVEWPASTFESPLTVATGTK